MEDFTWFTNNRFAAHDVLQVKSAVFALTIPEVKAKRVTPAIMVRMA